MLLKLRRIGDSTFIVRHVQINLPTKRRLSSQKILRYAASFKKCTSFCTFCCKINTWKLVKVYYWCGRLYRMWLQI